MVPRTPGVYRLTADLVVTNENLIIDGCLFSGPGRIILSGIASLTGNGTLSNGGGGNAAVLIQDFGSYSIQGLRFQNVVATASILIVPTTDAVMSSVSIIDNTFNADNYGILRNGGLGTISRTTIVNNKFSNMQGDAIELNVVPNDRNIRIANNNLSHINNTLSQPFWGIGIGVAGVGYGDAFADGQVAQDFVIEGNSISGARQGIHVESGKLFKIQNNTLDDISNSYSQNAGLETAGIVTYGSAQFTIEKNAITRQDSGAGILIAPGVSYAWYVGLPINFSVDGNKMNNLSELKGIRWATKGTASITNNTGGSFAYTGGPAGINISGNVWAP